MFMFSVHARRVGSSRFLQHEIVRRVLRQLRRINIMFAHALHALLIRMMLLINLTQGCHRRNVTNNRHLLINSPRNFVAHLFRRIRRQQLHRVRVQILFVNGNRHLLRSFGNMQAEHGCIVGRNRVQVNFVRHVRLQHNFAQVAMRARTSTLNQLTGRRRWDTQFIAQFVFRVDR